MGVLSSFISNWISMFSMIAMYWVLGIVLGSLISVFGKNKLYSTFAAMADRELGLFGLVPATLIGIVSPLCMYGTLPIAAAFSKKGMREDWLAAFMVGSILINPQLLWYTGVLGWGGVTLRFANSFFCAIAAGLLIHFFFKNKKFFNFKIFDEKEDRDTDPNIFLRLLKNLWRNLKATGPAFVIGVSLAALFDTVIPADVVADLFGKHRTFAYIIALSMGVPLFFCGGATIPLLLMWLTSGMSWGTAVILMMTGQALKIVNLGALKVILGIKHFIIYILFIIIFALVNGFIVDLFPVF